MQPKHWRFTIRLRLRSLFRSTQADQELDEELRDHLERKTGEYVAQGMTQEEARRRARLDLGGIEQTKEKCRDARRVNWFQDFVQDLHFGLRMLRKSPGFTLVAVLTLALGIGLNSAIFSLLDALVLRPLPVREPESLIRVGPIEAEWGINIVPGPVLDWLRREPILQGVCGMGIPLVTVEVRNTAMPVGGLSLTGDCYETLGVRPALGRLLTPADDISNGPRVVVLSYDFWQQQFASNPNVVGQIIRIDGKPFTIIGVTESAFRGPLLGFPTKVSFPITQEASSSGSDRLGREIFYWADAFARLKPGITQERVKAKLSVEWRRILDDSLPERFKGAERDKILNEPLGVASGAGGLDYMLRKRFQKPLAALLAISGLVLLVSCVNVANLFLVRGLQRRRDISVRLALGASRFRIARELLVESAIVLAGGFACALLVAKAGAHALVVGLSETYTGFDMTVGLDMRVLLFTGGAALVSLVFFALLPARHSSDVNLVDALKSQRLMYSHSRSRRILVCAQIALTVVLVMSACLFVETLHQLRNQSLGFRAEDVLDVQLTPLPGGYGPRFAPGPYYRDLMEQMEHLPGVLSVSRSHFSPLDTISLGQDVRRAGASTPSARAHFDFVSDNFFATMDIPLLRGRDFQRMDTPESPKTAIVSESLAKHLFPNAEALGRHITVDDFGSALEAEIVGIAADARLWDPRASDLSFLYLNLWQRKEYQGWGDFQLRYSGNPAPVASAVRHELQQAGHEYAPQLRTVAEQRDIALVQERLLAALGTAYGVLGLTLAAVGLFGLLKFLVSARTNEIGIRMALGAKRRDVSWFVMRESLALVGTGLLIGFPVSYATARALSGLLYGVGPLPLLPALVSIVILLGSSAIATAIPVRRATSIDPIVALRYE